MDLDRSMEKLTKAIVIDTLRSEDTRIL